MMKVAVSDTLTGDADEMEWQMVSPHCVGEAAERDDQRTCVPLQDVTSVTQAWATRLNATTDFYL